jgi:hypothetical protein
MSHFHAIAGMHGYLPNSNDVCESYSQAVESLVFLHELGRKRAAVLKRDGYLELNLRRDGNEYCEVSECQEEDCEEDF